MLIETPNISATVSFPPRFELLAELELAAERHLVFGHGDIRVRLCLRHLVSRSADFLLIPRDTCASVRIAAAARFERVTRGDRHKFDPFETPSPYHRSRLVQLLAICDALDAGASSRDIAFGLMFTGHSPLAGAAWKGSGERRHTHRLIAEARHLVGGGYRQLLLHN